MCLKRFVLLLVFLPLLAWSQTANQSPSQALTGLSQSIHETLNELKQESLSLSNELKATTELLEIRSKDLQLSEAERMELQTNLNDLNGSLMSMIGKYNESSKSMILLQAKVDLRNRIIFWLGLVCGVFLALKFLRIILGLLPQTATVVNAFAATKIGKLVDIII